MAKVIFRAGKVALVVIVPLAILGIILFGINVFSVAQADTQPASNTIPPEVQQIRADATVYIAEKNYDLAQQSYYEIIDGYPETEYAMDALGEVGRLYALQGDDDSVAIVMEQLYADFSTQPRVPRTIDRVAQAYISRNETLIA